jgi:RNA polymerase sigma factor (TIGR02999 family)
LLGGDASFQNRAHFFAAAAEAMRRILVERARRQSRIKRGGDLQRAAAENLDDVAVECDLDHDEILALDDALGDLEAMDPRKASVVKLRFFVGLEVPETASVLDVSPSTVKNDWAFARAWLHARLHPDPGAGPA